MSVYNAAWGCGASEPRKTQWSQEVMLSGVSEVTVLLRAEAELPGLPDSPASPWVLTSIEGLAGARWFDNLRDRRASAVGGWCPGGLFWYDRPLRASARPEGGAQCGEGMGGRVQPCALGPAASPTFGSDDWNTVSCPSYPRTWLFPSSVHSAFPLPLLSLSACHHSDPGTPRSGDADLGHKIERCPGLLFPAP